MKRDGSGLRLNWRKTWDDQEHDFTAEAEGVAGPIGRMYLIGSGGSNNGRWHWSMMAKVGNVGLSDRGVAETAHKAALEIERCWFQAGEPLLKQPSNPYAAAKGR